MLNLLKWPIRQLIQMLTFLVSEPALDHCICYHCNPEICKQLCYPKGCFYKLEK